MTRAQEVEAELRRLAAEADAQSLNKRYCTAADRQGWSQRAFALREAADLVRERFAGEDA